MQTVSARFSSIPGTEAALGWSGAHSILADRPEGRAGGAGMGFNGAQMLALALGACFCNDLRYIAHRRQAAIASLWVTVDLDLDGDPVLALAARMRVGCVMADGSDPAGLIAEAERSSMVSNSLIRGLPVRVAPADRHEKGPADAGPFHSCPGRIRSPSSGPA